MSSAALRAEIRDLVEAFTTDLEAIVRRAALETVAQALGGTTASSAPSRAPRTAVAAQRTTKSSPPRPGRGASSGSAKVGSAKGASEGAVRIRRSAEQIEATADRIAAHVEKHPGARAEDIRAALDLAKNEWTLTVKRLTETNRLVTKGEKRATVYFAKGAPKLGIIRRPGRGAAVSEPPTPTNSDAG